MHSIEGNMQCSACEETHDMWSEAPQEVQSGLESLRVGVRVGRGIQRHDAEGEVEPSGVNAN